MSGLTLAQLVAARGGIRPDPSRDAEIARIRALNRTLRGRRRVVSPSGQAFDLLARKAQEAGFQVASEDEFLDALEQDAIALAAKQASKGRVFVDYESTEDDDLAWYAYHAQMDAYSKPDHDHTYGACTVCGKPCEDGLCTDCADWASDAIRELLSRKEQERQCMRFFETMRGTI